VGDRSGDSDRDGRGGVSTWDLVRREDMGGGDNDGRGTKEKKEEYSRRNMPPEYQLRWGINVE